MHTNTHTHMHTHTHFTSLPPLLSSTLLSSSSLLHPPPRPGLPLPSPSSHLPPSAPSLLPSALVQEGDILHKWRLRRRLEEAHSQTASLTSRLDDGVSLFTARAGGARAGGGRVGDVGSKVAPPARDQAVEIGRHLLIPCARPIFSDNHESRGTVHSVPRL